MTGPFERSDIVAVKIVALVEILRARGFLVGDGQDCCGACASHRLFHEAEEQGVRKVAFFTEQDVEFFDEGGDVYFAYGDATTDDFVPTLEYAVGQEIKECAELCGLMVAWDGTPQQKIGIIGKVH